MKKLFFLLIISIFLLSLVSSQTINNTNVVSKGINTTITIGNYEVNFTLLKIENNSICFWNLSYVQPCSERKFYNLFNYTTANSSITLPCQTMNITNPLNNSYPSTYSNNYTINTTNNIFGIKNITLTILNATNNIVHRSTTSFIGVIADTVLGKVVSLADGLYKWFYSLFDVQGNNFITQNNTLTIAIPPVITITNPQSIYYSTKNNLALDYNVTDDAGIGVNYTLYYLVNSTNNIIISNTTLNGSTTFSVPRDDTYNLTIFSTDLAGNSNISSVRFGVYSAGPVILLKTPTDNSWTTNYSVNFSFDITDLNSISICSIYTNITGNWNPFYTFFPPIKNNGTMSVIRNINTNGFYLWNVWCIDSQGLNNFALNNFQFGVDNQAPIIRNVSIPTILGSQTASFSFNASDDASLGTCWRSIVNSTGQVDPATITNLTIPCNSAGNSFTVSAYGSYSLQLWANDTAGNLAFSNTSFSISPIVPTPPSSGGGNNPTTIIITVGTELSQNFSVVSSNYGNLMDLVLAKGSVKARYKEFVLVNKGKDEINITLYCDSTEVDKNISQIYSNKIDICDYVYFDQREIRISPNEDTPTKGKVYVNFPKDANFGDKYAFNVIALRNISQGVTTYSKLSMTVRVPIWALIFKYSYIPFQESDKPNKSMYPVSAVALPASFLILLSFVFLLRKKFPVLGFLFGFVAGVISFILMIIWF